MMQLSAKQAQVVECDTHCLGVACPGSGKSRVLVQKALHILKADSSATILMVSFTQDSAAELKKRVLVQDSAASRKVGSGTFHSLGFHQLKTQLKDFKRSVLSPGQMLSYVERAHKECKFLPRVEKIGELVALIEHLKQTPGYEPENDEHGRLYHAYQKLTERNKVIDFTDMLAMSVTMMRSGELKPIKCTHLLVDEAQDLDELQYAWCVEHIVAAKDRPGAIVTVVGDDDQSIYKFRRALGYKGMLRFQEEFDAKLIKLDTNYRCRPEILASAGTVIKHNVNRVTKSLTADRSAGGVIEAWRCTDAADEARLVIEAIREICADNPIPPPVLTKDRDENGAVKLDGNNEPVMKEYYYTVGVKPGQWAVLARNNQILRVLASAMRAAGVPHKYGGKTLWSDQPVCFVISLLVSLVTKQQAGFDSALHCAGLEEDTIERLHCDFGGDYFEMFSQITYVPGLEKKYGKSTMETLTAFNKHVTDWQNNMRKKWPVLVISGVFNWFIENLPMMYRAEKDPHRKYMRDRRNLEICSSIMVAMPGSIMERVAMLLGPEDDGSDEKDDRKRAKDALKEECVSLGTLHSSKGLEYENVWMFALNEDVIPDMKSAADDASLIQEVTEEERRLFYVGMTRAKDRLYMSCHEEPSSFILETGVTLGDASAIGEAEKAA